MKIPPELDRVADVVLASDYDRLVAAKDAEIAELSEKYNAACIAEKEHCKDCCCARSWAALGITEYTGKSIPEHIVELRAQLAEAQTNLAEQHRNQLDLLERLNEAQAKLEEAGRDGHRYRWLLDDPSCARHLLHLLELGKGNKADFTKMVDRLKASKTAALAKEGK